MPRSPRQVNDLLVGSDGLDLLAQERLARAQGLELRSEDMLKGGLGVLQLCGQGCALRSTKEGTTGNQQGRVHSFHASHTNPNDPATSSTPPCYSQNSLDIKHIYQVKSQCFHPSSTFSSPYATDPAPTCLSTSVAGKSPTASAASLLSRKVLKAGDSAIRSPKVLEPAETADSKSE